MKYTNKKKKKFYQIFQLDMKKKYNFDYCNTDKFLS